MPALPVTHTSTVTEDQIDHLGHMNVRFYGTNAQAASNATFTRNSIAKQLSVLFDEDAASGGAAACAQQHTAAAAASAGCASAHEPTHSLDDDVASGGAAACSAARGGGSSSLSTLRVGP